VFWQTIEVLSYPEASIHGLIGELYQIQSQNWGTLVAHHIAHTAALCDVFCKGLRNHLTPQRTSNGYLDDVIEEALTRRVNTAKEELRKSLRMRSVHH
jgi:hypothetical protein